VGTLTEAIADDVRLVSTVPGGIGGHANVHGDRLYVGAYGYGMRIFDVADPGAPRLIGQYAPGPQGAGDPGARADAVPTGTVMDGREIAVLGGTSRSGATTQSEFLDVTDPEDPELLWRFTGAADGEAHNGAIAHERRLWLPSGGRGDNGLRLYDMNPLLGDEPAAPAVVFRGSPAALWEASPHRGDRPTGPAYDHTHDLQIYLDHEILLPESEWVDGQPTYGERDIIFVAEGGRYLGAGNTGSIFIIDITDPANPVALNRWRHEQDDPTGHPIRYYHEVQLLDSDPSVMIVSDEDLHSGCDAGGIYTVRLSEDLLTAEKLGDWFNGTGTPAPVCSVHVFSSQGPYVFIGSYNAGLQVVDLTDPTRPVRAGQYIAPGANSWGALYHEGYIYVGDFGARGLDVFEFIPDAIAQGTVVTNPATTTAAGVNELTCEETGQPAPVTLDALMVELPEGSGDGTQRLRAVGSGHVSLNTAALYNLKVYFYDGDCQFMSGRSLNADDPDVSGPVPRGAVFAAVTNAGGR
jgi:hypothetical protein